ncbi:glycosyltransferase family 2 protein [Haloferax sp. YSSS75]|uniref:glycosyltransferase family 2 protein n=1 Tax=Haloferax sp. YSSS75 TaxID=3388564 RepID=UPI00398D228A
MIKENGTHDGQDDGFAVGFLATDDNFQKLTRDIVRMQNHGIDVFVTYQESVDAAELSIISALGATVVEPTTEPGRVDLYRTFANVSDGKNLVLVHHTDGALDDVLNEESTTPTLTKASNGLGPASFPDSVSANVDQTDESASGFGVGSYGSEGREPQSSTPGPTIVAIPAYNEEGTIADVVKKAVVHVDEVLVIDDGSRDQTAVNARNAGATVVEHGENRGYGAALHTAFDEARKRNTSRLVTIDADGQHDPNEIPKLLRTLDRTGAELVIGSRFGEGASTNAPIYRLFGLKFINLMTNLSMGVVRRGSRVSDTQSGFRAYNRRAIASICVDSGIGDQMNASTDILYHAHHNDYRIEETGVWINYDVENPSSHHPIMHGLSLVSNIMKTVERERPLTALGVPGFFGSAIGVIIAYFAISDYLTNGVFQIEMAVTSTLFVIVGLLTCFTAIILHSMSRLFEINQSTQSEYPPLKR